jgi:hypothetical protein
MALYLISEGVLMAGKEYTRCDIRPKGSRFQSDWISFLKITILK